MKNIIRFVVSITLVYTFFFAGLPRVNACGPFIISPVFSLKSHADFPLPAYTGGGQTGIVPASFGEMSLIVFYRQLKNLPLTKEEQKQVINAMENRIYYRDGVYDTSTPDSPPDPGLPGFIENWLAARAKVTGEKRDIETEKRIEDGYNYFTNCLPDAFNTAAKTLESRIAAHGNNDNAKEWVKGQDTVFSNCEEAKGAPEPLGGNAPEWLRQDRAYQIAAAKFYMGDFPGARAEFEQIAADKNSAWKNTARFVAARTLIRQASFAVSSDAETPDPQAEQTRKEFLQQAAERFEKILADDSMKEFHRSAFGLLGLVKYRLIPEQRQKELAERLASPAENRNIYNDLIDYTWLLEKITAAAEAKGSALDQAEAEKAGKEYDYYYRLKLRDVPAEDRRSELTDWLLTYQAVDGFGHAFDKWKETGKAEWLVAAIAQADVKTGQTAELLTAAGQIKPNSPAFPTIRYHQVRLLIETGKRGEARRKLDEVIGGNFKQLPLSTRNKFLAQRMTLAENLEDFLKYAPRRAVIFDWDIDGREEGTSLKNDEYLSKWADREMFDTDAAAFLNEKVPLAVLRDAALSPQLPEHLKRFLVIAVWTRAFVLGNQAVAREFTPLMTRYAPEYAPEFTKYANARTAAEREANGLLAILSYPVIQPYVPVGFGREDSDPKAIDSIRGNWWCAEDEASADYSSYDSYNFEYPQSYPDFLTEAQKAAAEKEHRQMLALGDSATLLARRAVTFANQNPRSPQVPEILHLAVRSTRYGCKDENTGTFSKQAFDILHTRYRNSPWTKKTPYWFAQ